jgi:cryptochrome
MPKKYIYEPWKCPESIQKEVGCIVGKNYPNRIIDHVTASRLNRKVSTNRPLYPPAINGVCPT